jgi:hypothetical protein
VLLGAGIVLLLNNLQVVPWSIWRDVWPYWPVLLILLGLEAFVSGRVAWGSLLLLIVLLPLVGFGVSAGEWAGRWRSATSAANVPSTPAFSQALDGATSASIALEYGAGALTIGPLPADLQTTVLADGLVAGHENVRFEVRSTVRDGQRRLRINPNDFGHHFDPGRLELRLSPAIPTDLSIKSGVSEMQLNLESLRIPNLSIETGASRANVILPSRGQTNAVIEGGAARIEVTIPENVAARITVESGPNQIQVDQSRFPRRGNSDQYVSPNYDSATDRVNLRIEVGASHLTVQ